MSTNDNFRGETKLGRNAEVKDEETLLEAMRSKLTRMEDFTTIYLLGSGGAGKTTLINRLLEKNDLTKPTIALDYTFVRRSIPDPKDPLVTIKQVCNIWELGGDVLYHSDLIEPPVSTNHALDKLAIFLVLDLSAPQKLWMTLESAVVNLKRSVTRVLADCLRNNISDMTQKLDDNISKRLGDEFPDKKYIEPFPLALVFICTKFDVFQEYEPEKKKLLSRFIRLAANYLGAAVIYFSKNDIAHNKRIRELFTHYAFGTAFPQGACHDLNKGLMIPHGGDFYEQIWPGTNPRQFTLDYFKHLFETQIGKYDVKDIHRDDPSDDPNFREPLIDKKRQLLLEEIRMSQEAAKEDMD